MSSFTCQQLDPVMYPLVNKFYQNFKVRGRAKSHDRVWVIKAENQIVAAAKLSLKDGQFLLSGVFTAPCFRGQKLASRLIKTITLDYRKPFFTFAYNHLVSWYQSCGFTEHAAPAELAPFFSAYQNQGRQIVCMIANKDCA
ncbi:MAG: GNAT family N-acetyltransferase [Pseudomonadota bacterium]|nr:GNAT family N-acetyltransferase [Pseudomonadota bacterium]